MDKLTLKQKIMAAVLAIGIALIALFRIGLGGSNTTQNAPQPPAPTTPQAISTNPAPLDNAILLPTQSIEITFNMPIENTGEFKHEFDSKLDYKLELSSDRKTIKIIPLQPYKLGQGYTLKIKPETKFDGQKRLEQEIFYHFSTISYNGV